MFDNRVKVNSISMKCHGLFYYSISHYSLNRIYFNGSPILLIIFIQILLDRPASLSGAKEASAVSLHC